MFVETFGVRDIETFYLSIALFIAFNLYNIIDGGLNQAVYFKKH